MKVNTENKNPKGASMAKVSEMNEKEIEKEQEKLLTKHWDTPVVTDIIRAYELGRRMGGLTLSRKSLSIVK